jgi:hypothetical protein
MRVINFADGFVSTAVPIVDDDGAALETYLLLNNQTNTTILTIDSLSFKSAFIDFEITRKDVSNSYIQTGQLSLYHTSTGWVYSIGMTNNDDIVSYSIDNPFNVVFSFTNSGTVGTLRYSSGNMGSSYEGKLKILISRVKIL